MILIPRLLPFLWVRWYSQPMEVGGPMLAAFVDELQKISVAQGRMRVPKAREGRRSISVENLLKKDRQGRLMKKHGDSQGNPQDVRGDSVDDPGAAKPPKRHGEVPTRGSQIPEVEKDGAALPENALLLHGSTSAERSRNFLKDRTAWGKERGMTPEAMRQLGEEHAKTALQKTGYRLTDTTQPFTSGEEPAISAETRKPRQPGDVPTQTTQEAMISPPSGGGISFGQAKGEALRGRKKGDVPTRDRDINLIDRFDNRESTTTVHGIAQHSSDIAASNVAAEHS